VTYTTAAAWATGPGRVYGALAATAVDLLPDVRGALVLDAGTGTGAAADALRARGARVLPVDRSPAMLTYGDPLWPVVGDVTGLPLRAASVDGAVAAFVLNHLPDPLAGLAELTRVARTGGPVLATTFRRTPRPTR
jgi:ubiquinone/menaquinone biosynthesis C-methylase UbiE